MNFNPHLNLVGKHAFLSASKYHWINYDEEKLTTAFYQISEQLYKQNAANNQTTGPEAGATSDANTGDGNVYDADYKVEEDGNNSENTDNNQ